MVKIVIKTISFMVGCLLLSSVAQASSQPTIVGLGLKSTQSKTVPFYCIVYGDTKGTVYMRDVAAYVTGFTTGGELNISIDKLNSVYFESYHDPSLKFDTTPGYVSVEIIGQKRKGYIVCIPGEEGVNRTPVPPPYGTSDM